MSLDSSRLEKVRQRSGKLLARCPACAEMGEDRKCDNLMIWETGAYKCIKADVGTPHHKRIWKLAGDPTTAASPRPLPFMRTEPVAKPVPRIPQLRTLSVTDMAQIAHLRGWTYFAGLQLLASRGLLWCGDVWDGDRTWPAWIITDCTRRNAQARRLDGQRWEWIEKKVKTLKGCDPCWPIGAAEIGDRPYVILCEGGPDFLAALFVAWFEGIDHRLVAPVCMTGAGNSIHLDALPYFAGKHVRIATHDDDAGLLAGERWWKQLADAGAVDGSVDRLDFHDMTRTDGQPVNDLADYATLIGIESPPIDPVFSDFVATAAPVSF